MSQLKYHSYVFYDRKKKQILLGKIIIRLERRKSENLAWEMNIYKKKKMCKNLRTWQNAILQINNK